MILLSLTSCGGKNSPPNEVPISPPPAQPKTDISPTQGIWVTFQVMGEEFKAVITQPDAVNYVLGYFSGHESKKVPNGKLEAGSEFNPGLSWHLDSDSIAFAEQTIEVCDGRPSYVEQHHAEWISNVGNYCPWSAVMQSMRDCRSGNCSPEIASKTPVITDLVYMNDAASYN